MGVEGESIEKYTAVLIAQYLKKHGYNDSLKAFLRDASLPVSAADPNEHINSNIVIDDLQSIIIDRVGYNNYLLEEKLRDLTLNNELAPIDHSILPVKRWNFNIKFNDITMKKLKGMPIALNFLYNKDDNLIVSTSTRELSIFDSNLEFKQNLTDEQSKSLGVVKLIGLIPNTNISYICTMDGSIYLFDTSFALIPNSKTKLQDRMITHIQFSQINEKSWYVVTAGLDNTLRLNMLTIKNDTPMFNELCRVKVLSACTTLNMAKTNIVLNDKPTTRNLIFLTRMDFTHVACYMIDDKNEMHNIFNVALNNAQFSTHSFNVRDIVLIDTSTCAQSTNINNSTIIGVATSHVPYMRLVLVEIPDIHDAIHKYYNDDLKNSLTKINTYYDKILRNIATQIPQDSYSQPILKVLKKCNGLIVGGDSGVYAIDLDNGESWEIELTGFIKGARIKTMEVNQLNSNILIGSADKSVYFCHL